MNTFDLKLIPINRWLIICRIIGWVLGFGICVAVIVDHEINGWSNIEPMWIPACLLFPGLIAAACLGSELADRDSYKEAKKQIEECPICKGNNIAYEWIVDKIDYHYTYLKCKNGHGCKISRQFLNPIDDGMTYNT